MRLRAFNRVLQLVLLATAGWGCADSLSAALFTISVRVGDRDVLASDTLAMSAIADTLRMTTLVTDYRGRPMPNRVVTWETTDPAVATVDTAGCVVAQGNGMTTIRVAFGGVAQLVLVRVQQVPATLDISVASPTLIVNDTLPANAVLRDSNGIAVTGTAIEWTSTAPQVAHIDPSGWVHGRYAGEAVIEGRAAGMSKSVAITVRPRPLMSWIRERYSGNPVIQAVLDNPAESLSQYVPAPIRLPSGDIWAYVKGDRTHSIWAYKSTDGGRRFVVQGKAIGVGIPGAWDATYAFDPTVVYDETTNTIHLWYKGTDDPMGRQRWSWGHASASGSDPLTFEKDPANPILTPGDIEAALGESGVTDNSVSSIVRIAGEYFFYGTFRSSAGYKIFYAKGNDWNAPVPQGVLLTPDTGFDIVQVPTVFLHPDTLLYEMIFSEGLLAPPGERHLVVAHSPDGLTWNRQSGLFLGPSDNINARGNQPWESMRVYGASILRSTLGTFADPLFVDGRYLLYYSGSSVAYGDETGLLFLTPAASGP